MLKVKSLILLLNSKLVGQACKKSLTTFSKMVLIIMPFLTLTGCYNGNISNEKAMLDEVLNAIPYEEFDNTTITYDKPEMYPSCIVDRNGYEIGEEKKALFIGNNIPVSYNVVNQTTGEVVYEGYVDHKADYSFADISELNEPGEYYILCDVIGQSYPFSINDDMYTDRIKMLQSSIVNMHHRDDVVVGGADVSGGWNTGTEMIPAKDVVTGSKTVLNLIVATELQPDIIDRDSIYDEINYECQWLIKMQDESGAVSAFVNEGLISETSMDATAYMSAALGTFSGIYKDYDAEVSDRYLFQAESAYEYLRKQRAEDGSSISDELWFLVNSALFRTTGKTTYRNELSEYYKSAEFYGTYLLLTTPRIADPDVCFELMEKRLSVAADISAKSHNNPYLISGMENLYEDLLEIAFINSVITNREYRRVLQNGIHYIDGRNEKSVFIIPDNIYDMSLQLIIYSNAKLVIEE